MSKNLFFIAALAVFVLGLRDVQAQRFLPIQSDVNVYGFGSRARIGGSGEMKDFSPGNQSKALATSDFNGDGFDDLAIGAPESTVLSGGPVLQNPGAVILIMGKAERTPSLDLAQTDANFITIFGPTSFARAGYALAAGDENEDGIADLIIGCPGADSVYVLFGSHGFGATKTINLQSEFSLLFRGNSGLGFGSAIAVGKVGTNLGEKAGLLVGAPSGTRVATAGAAFLFIDGSLFLTIRGEGSQRFGTSVAIGDFNNDGKGDIFIGAPNSNRAQRDNPIILFALETGAVFGWLGNLNPGIINSNNAGVSFYGQNQGGNFGQSIVLGDVNDDSITDLLAFGTAQRQTDPAQTNLPPVASVLIFAGSSNLNNRYDVKAGEDTSRVISGGAVEFTGSSFVVASFNKFDLDDIHPDLIISKRGGSKNNLNSGGFSLLQSEQIGRERFDSDFDNFDDHSYGIYSSVTGKSNLWNYGTALAVGDFDSDGRIDLAVSCPFASFVDSLGRVRDEAGLVKIYYGEGSPIQPPPGPIDRQIRFTSSIGTSTLAGRSEAVSWTHPVDAQSYDLYLSTNGGATFPMAVAQGLSPNQTSLTFNVPNLCAGRARLQIVANFATPIQPTKDSSGEFSISEPGPVISLASSSISKKALVLIAGDIGFVSGVTTLEISSDAGGASFASFDNSVSIGSKKIKAKGSIAGQSLASYFPDGSVRLIRIRNSLCSTTLIRVRRSDSLMVAE